MNPPQFGNAEGEKDDAAKSMMEICDVVRTKYQTAVGHYAHCIAQMTTAVETISKATQLAEVNNALAIATERMNLNKGPPPKSSAMLSLSSIMRRRFRAKLLAGREQPNVKPPKQS